MVLRISDASLIGALAMHVTVHSGKQIAGKFEEIELQNVGNTQFFFGEYDIYLSYDNPSVQSQNIYRTLRYLV